MNVDSRFWVLHEPSPEALPNVWHAVNVKPVVMLAAARLALDDDRIDEVKHRKESQTQIVEPPGAHREPMCPDSAVRPRGASASKLVELDEPVLLLDRL